MPEINIDYNDKKNKITQIKARIIFNKQIIPGFFKLCIDAPFIAGQALPGQFLNIKINDTYNPLLRKPLGIHKVSLDKKNFGFVEILYKIVGSGTQKLSLRKEGESLDVLGPLGNGFAMPDSQFPLLVAGGIGVAPLLFFAEKCTNRPIVFIGASTKTHILCEKEFKDLGCKVWIATDDGSRGFKGRITDLLTSQLSTIDSQLSTIYACGPRSMLKEAARISKSFDMNCFGLLEAYMACGTGACFGCVVATTTGFKRVCKDGPVFDLKLIQW